MNSHNTISPIFKAVLKDAPGIFSAYLTPESYAMESMSVGSLSNDPDETFRHEINSRIEKIPSVR